MDVFTAMSFCSGYEGIGLGLKRAIPNLRTICYVEIEAYAIANLVAKIKENKLDDAPVWDDIKTFDPKPFAGLVDIIHSGYPCQPFSVAGKRKGEADERHLWPFIRDHIQQIRPVFVFLENVAGHLRLGFDRVVRDLDELGYTVEADLFTASEVGAPHRRERLFILGYAERCGLSRDSRRGAGSKSADGYVQLAYAGFNDGRQCQPKQQQKELPEEFSGGDKLADTASQRIQGHEPTGDNQPQRPAHELRNDQWPARPGQEQYDWEEPRTVESGMGRTVDGFASRVDELRLLGNGVVPAQAELAFRTLYERLTK